MRLAAIVLATACAAACSPDDPRFGDPGAIAKQTFPGEPPAGGDGGAASFAPFPKAYDANDPPKDTRTGAAIHQGQATIDATTDCTTCHGATPIAGAPKFAFAGLAFDGPGSKTPLAFGEVIVYTPDKVVAIVKTTSDGFFAWKADQGTVPDGAKAAVRDAHDKVSKMTSTATGACNATTCHGGAAGRIDFQP